MSDKESTLKNITEFGKQKGQKTFIQVLRDKNNKLVKPVKSPVKPIEEN